MVQLVKIGKYGSSMEAELVRARLESNGIPAVVQADDAAGTIPNLAFTRGIKVFVRPSDLEQALEVLERMLPPPG